MQSEQFATFLGVFVDVAREHSFSGAARRRGRSPSSIGRQIDALEAYLETPLFLRSTRHLTLTDAGEALLVRAREILDSLVDVRQEIASMKGDVSGVLRLACYPSFGKRYILPVIGQLARQYPDLAFHLDLTERLAEPVADRLDLVIRIGVLDDSTLISSRIAEQKSVLCASPSYLSRAGVPKTGADLATHRLIDKIHGADLLKWHHLLGQPVVGNGMSTAIFACDDFEGMRQAAIEGLGLAYLPDWVVGEDIQAGHLTLIQPLWLADEPPKMGIYALRALRHPPARVTAFLDALRAYIGHPARWAEACSDNR